MTTVSATTNYDALRAAIVSGDIAPDARLVEADVSATFGMSRGAVRTALIRLEQDGLVVREPHRGARVRKVSDEEAVEILQARAVLEGLAVRQTAERIDRPRAGPACRRASSGNAALLEAGDLLGASDANADLHATLLEISRHGTARRLIRALSSQTVRYQYRTILIPGRSAASRRSTRRSSMRSSRSPRRRRRRDAQPSVQRRRGRAARAAPGRHRQCEPRCALRSRAEHCSTRRGRSGQWLCADEIVDNIGADLVDSNIREPGWPPDPDPGRADRVIDDEVTCHVEGES